MSNHSHCHSVTTPSVHQSLDELEFERGIWSAALDGDESKVKTLICKGTAPDMLDAAGYTALHYAARAGRLKVAHVLVAAGANINAVTRAGSATPLHRAAAAGHLDMVKFLLEKGALVDIKDADGQNSLHRAAHEGRRDVACHLLATAPQLKTVSDSRGRLPRDCAPNSLDLDSL